LQQLTVPGVLSRLTCSYHDVHAELHHFEEMQVLSLPLIALGGRVRELVAVAFAAIN
jgi:hypothetical protein